MNPGHELCGVTGKLMFSTQEAAQGFLAAHGRSRGARKITRRCVFCNHYHTTKGIRGRGGKGK